MSDVRRRDGLQDLSGLCARPGEPQGTAVVAVHVQTVGRTEQRMPQYI